MGFVQGTYIPKSGKCTHTTVAKYRSSYELAFLEMLDRSPKIVHWNYEHYYIAYMFRGKKHHYLVDFDIEFADGRKFLIEIKPRCFFDRAMQMHDKNWHKWNAAISFCNKQGWTFKVIDEVSIPALRSAWT